MQLEILAKHSEYYETKKKKKRKEVKLELIVAVMLGIVALLTAWAGWIGSLHGGNQTANFASSNILSAEGNSKYNEAMQLMMQDMILYNEIMIVLIDLTFAEYLGDRIEYERAEWRLEQLWRNASPQFSEAFMWSAEMGELIGELVSPFESDELIYTYFWMAIEVLDEADYHFDRATRYGSHADAFGLVTVFYTVSLFLLGITGTFNHKRNKLIVFFIAVGALAIATVYMAFLPMPTDFSLSQFFGG